MCGIRIVCKSSNILLLTFPSSINLFSGHSFYERVKEWHKWGRGLGIMKEERMRRDLYAQWLARVRGVGLVHRGRIVLYRYFPSHRWGSSLTVCARWTVRSSPHQHERTFSGARVCRVTFKHLPQPLRSHIWSFGTLGIFLKFSKKKIKNLKMPPRGLLGVSEFVGGLISPFLWWE
jgi:hypothetical protein